MNAVAVAAGSKKVTGRKTKELTVHIETERYVIRYFQKEDFRDFYEIFSDPIVMKTPNLRTMKPNLEHFYGLLAGQYFALGHKE